MTDDGQWKTVFYHYDGLGSVVALTDEKGKVVAEYDYSPFGRIINWQGGEAKRNHFTYTGREYDPNSGFYFNRNRYRDPRPGIFTSRDPILYQPSQNGWIPQYIPSGGGCTTCGGTRISNYSPWVPVPTTAATSAYQHPYVYCANNPINYTDPMGLWWTWEDWQEFGKDIGEEMKEWIRDKLKDMMKEKAKKKLGGKTFADARKACDELKCLDKSDSRFAATCQMCAIWKCYLGSWNPIQMDNCIKVKFIGCLNGQSP